MIRSTLFKSVAPALRDSLNDAEVGALGLWLLMSAGAYPRGLGMYAKDGAGTDELEAVATAKYIYPEGSPQEELMAGGMTNPDYRLPTANRMTAANVIAGLEDLMYTIATSNEEHDNPHRGTVVPAPEGAGVPAWQVNPFQVRPDTFNDRAITPPPHEDRIVSRERALANMPRFDVQPGAQRAQAEEILTQAAAAMQAQLADEEHQRNVRDFLRTRDEIERTENEAAANRGRVMMERVAREREAERNRLDELANRTRGIPNRR